MTDVAKLYELQKIDTNWEKVKRRLIQIQKLLGEPDDIKAIRQQTVATEDELHKWHAAQQNAELESQALLQKTTSSEQLLMGGQVHSAKELQALQSSIEALKRQRSLVDEQGVEALLKVEEISTKLEQQKKRLAQLDVKLREKQGEMAEEEIKFKRLFLQLKTHRAKLTTAMTSSDVETYEEMRRRKAGIAVATVEKDQCSACNTRLPTMSASAAKDMSSISYCPTCGRILVNV